MTRNFALLLCVLLIGCASVSPPDLPTDIPVDAVQTALAATATPVPTDRPTHNPSLTPALIAPPTVSAAPLIVAPPGLLYITGDRDAAEHPLWVVDASGGTRKLENSVMDRGMFPDFDISADGTEILYALTGDIWRLDISTGTAFNLTNTPDRVESAPKWVGSTRAFVCGSVGVDEQGMTTGQLTYVDLEALTYKVVDQAFMTIIPAPHPNGEVVLYATYPEAAGIGGFDLKEYHIADDTIVPVDAAAYGLSDYGLTNRTDAPDALYTGSLSWNADGSKLGMALYGQVDGEERGIILVMDWATKTHEIVHTSLVPGMEAPFFNSAPRFPFQATWLVFEAPPANFGNTEIIVWDAGDRQGVSGDMILRGQWAAHPAISRDDQWVAFLTSQGLALMRAGEWKPIVISTEDVVIGVGWVTPPD